MFAAAIGGLVTGLALGLTGAGGTMLALPLLRGPLGLPLPAATTTSLAAVGAMSLVGAAAGVRSRDAQLRLAVPFALAGWLGAPIGAWLHSHLPEVALISAFTIAMAVVAMRMWRGASEPPLGALPRVIAAPACPFSGGRVEINSRCGRNLVASGVVVGVVSGLIGVGGGFLIVPALLRLTGMPMRAAVATSLVIVAFISAGGLVSHLALGHQVDVALATVFILGGAVGVALGSAVVQHLPQRVLQRGFAVLLVGIATALVAGAAHR